MRIRKKWDRRYHCDQCVGWRPGVRYPVDWKHFSFLGSVRHDPEAHPVIGYRGVFRCRYSGRSAKLSDHSTCIMLRLGMNGDVPLHSHCTFMACTGSTLCLYPPPPVPLEGVGRRLFQWRPLIRPRFEPRYHYQYSSLPSCPHSVIL